MFHSFYAGRVHEELEEQMESHAQFLTAQYEESCSDSQSVSCRNFLNRLGHVGPLHFWIVDRSGEVLLANERRQLPPLSARELFRAREGKTVVSMRRRAPAVVVVPVKNNNGVVEKLAVVERNLVMERFPRFPAFASLILVLITIAVLILPLSKRLTRPVRELHRAGEEWSEGRLEKRAFVSGKDEISDLSRTLNTMAGNLQVMLEQRKEFLAWISHELKSPLARMRIALEMISEKKDAEPETQILLKNIEWEITESEKLIEQLLILSKIEMNVPAAQEPVSLEKVVARVLEQAKSLAEISGIRLKAAGSATVPGDFYQLEKALSNILENAIKFSLRGQEVEMEIQQMDREVLLQCKDEGTGIEAGERVKIFDPFFRGSAGKGKEGTGLGLYIARRIIEMHGGSISAESRRPAGTVIVVRLPRDIR